MPRKLPANAQLGSEARRLVYVARKQGVATAVVLEAIAPDGYAGEIRLLVGIQADGRIAGVRVTAHKETPGLGDYIDIAQPLDQSVQRQKVCLSAPPTRPGKCARTAANSITLPALPSRRAP
jgi:RnfABCDGE-type electron transport complex G subunit